MMKLSSLYLKMARKYFKYLKPSPTDLSAREIKRFHRQTVNSPNANIRVIIVTNKNNMLPKMPPGKKFLCKYIFIQIHYPILINNITLGVTMVWLIYTLIIVFTPVYVVLFAYFQLPYMTVLFVDFNSYFSKKLTRWCHMVTNRKFLYALMLLYYLRSWSWYKSVIFIVVVIFQEVSVK